MKVSILQLDIAWQSPAENIRRAEALLQSRGQADLYVLPEMWTTGFAVRPENVAEEEEQSAGLRWMRRIAHERCCAISGSLAIKDTDGCYRNRHYFVTPDGVSFYDKHHLFTHGHENEFYTAGSVQVVAEWQGMRFLLQTCYDLRFPVFSRYGRAGEYDTIIYVANWPSSRMLAWNTLVRARAIENQCYVVAVNRIGNDPAAEYSGGSVVLDPLGRELSNADAVIDAERLRTMREKFRVLPDRD
ncbi:MAG: nitrilase family protein [Prevotella sp.]|nr:nitrilase family protein [Prevotella sp.]